MTEKLEFLKNVYLFQNIPEKYIKSLVKEMSLKDYVKGGEIIREGEKGESLFFLFKGKVAVTKKMTLFDDAQGRSQVDKALIKLKDSDYAFFGEMSLCGESEVRSATVIAESDCTLGEIGAAQIHELIKVHQDFGLKFYHNLANVLADRLRKANRDTLKLATALSLALEE
ncbi:MAG: cyclic nucleotide-binding domain-containing protein [Calditrichia bacterium]|jgi:CRP-like cAMP-binding protein